MRKKHTNQQPSITIPKSKNLWKPKCCLLRLLCFVYLQQIHLAANHDNKNWQETVFRGWIYTEFQCLCSWLIQGLTTDPSRVQQKVFKDGHHLFLSSICEFATLHIQRSLFSPMLESGLILENFLTKGYGRNDAIWHQCLGQKRLCSFNLSPLEHLLLELCCYTVGMSSRPIKRLTWGQRGLPIDGLTELPADNQEPPTSHVNAPSWKWIFQQHQLYMRYTCTSWGTHLSCMRYTSEPCPNSWPVNHEMKQNHCLKSLHFVIVCCSATDHSNVKLTIVSLSLSPKNVKFQLGLNR